MQSPRASGPDGCHSCEPEAQPKARKYDKDILSAVRTAVVNETCKALLKWLLHARYFSGFESDSIKSDWLEYCQAVGEVELHKRRKE